MNIMLEAACDEIPAPDGVHRLLREVLGRDNENFICLSSLVGGYFCGNQHWNEALQTRVVVRQNGPTGRR